MMKIKNDQKYTLLVGKVEGSQFVVYHMAVYNHEPRQVDIDSLRQECDTDEEFGLVGKMSVMEIRATTISLKNGISGEAKRV